MMKDRFIDGIQVIKNYLKTAFAYFDRIYHGFIKNLNFSSLTNSVPEILLTILLLIAYLNIFSIFFPGILRWLIITKLINTFQFLVKMDNLQWIVIIPIVGFTIRTRSCPRGVGKKIRKQLAICSSIALFLVLYLNTFPSATIPFQENIDSGVYIQKSKDISFDTFDGDVDFNRDSTIVENRINFNTNKLPDGGDSYYAFNPPPSTVNYSIKITGQKLNGNGEVITLLDIQNNSITNRSFPELKGSFTLDNDTLYDATIIYSLPEIKTHTVVSFRIYGHEHVPSLNHARYAVQFDELSYECMETCIVHTAEGLTTTLPVIRVRESKLPPKRNETYIQYDIKGEKVPGLPGVSFYIRALDRTQLLLRGVYLAMITGLIVVFVSGLIKDVDSK